MLCPLCEEYDEKESSVKAHICGRHDADHSGYVGLKDNGEPLSREENERRKQEPSEPSESNSGNGALAALALTGGAAIAESGGVEEALKNLGIDQNDRDTI